MTTNRRLKLAVAAILVYFGLVLSQALVMHLVTIPSGWYGEDPIGLSVTWGFRGAVIAVSCWLALGDGDWWLRCIVAVAVLTWAWIVAACGYNLSPLPEKGISYYVLIHTPFFLIATILPLVLLRIFCGVRLVCRESPLFQTPRQVSLLHALLVLAGFGFTLGAIRLVAPANTGHFGWLLRSFFYTNACIWTPFEVLIALPTSFLLVFRPRWWPAALVHFAIATLLVTVTERYLYGAWPPIQRLSFWTAYRAEQATVTMLPLVGLLFVPRLMGYRLELRRRTAEDGETTPPPAAA